jgi:lipopolysaccharide export system protein LptA
MKPGFASWLFALGVCAQGFSQSEKLIIIENADSLVAKVIEAQNARELIGNVRFTQDRVRVSCDKAIQFQQSGNVQLLGNVVVQDDSLTMRFPRGTYYRAERRAVALDSVQLDDGRIVLTARYGEYNIEPRKAFFRTHVVAEDRESKLIADSLTYFRTEQLTIALGRVEIQSFADNLTIRGNHFESHKKKQYSRMTERPVLVKFDTSTTSTKVDTLVVRSKMMESYRADSAKRLIASDSVEIIRSEMASVAGRAVFFTQGDSIQLRLSPVVWYQQTQVSGDSIDVFLKNNKLDVVEVMGNSFAISQSDSVRKNRFDQITGETLRMQFGDNGLERMDVNTRAISLYHLYEDSAANGLNKTSGDRIVMLWEQKKLNSINVLGGVEGQYFPENLVQDKEHEFTLAGFNWKEVKPMIRQSDFNPVPEKAKTAKKNE